MVNHEDHQKKNPIKKWFPGRGFGPSQRASQPTALHPPPHHPLTPRRLQTIGAQLGFSYGAAQIHYLFERAFLPGPVEEFSQAFLRGVENLQSFDTNPLYAILHESCYAQGKPTAWSAHRTRQSFPAFDAATSLAKNQPPLLTGEMIFPWMLEEWTALATLAPAADELAQATNWPTLYDPTRLAANQVPVAAVIYHDDMFVPTETSLDTARRIRGLVPWVTNEFEHDGLRSEGSRVFDRLSEDLRLSRPR